MKEAYLVIDIGTGTTRAAVVSGKGDIVALKKIVTMFQAEPAIEGSGRFDPIEWKNDLFVLIKDTVAYAAGYRVVGVTSCSFREGIVLLDSCGEPLDGYMNSDRRGLPFMEELDWEVIWQEAGLYPSPIYSAVKMLGTRRLQPEVYNKIHTVTSVSDWIGYMLTGKLVWERAQAMHSCLYDPVLGDWSRRLCGIFGIDMALLPPVFDAGVSLGEIPEDICIQMGLSLGAQYIVGTADTQSALIGIGAEEGELAVVSGTTSPVTRIIGGFEKYPMSWTSPGAEKGSFMLEVNTFSSGINTQRFKENLLPDRSYQELNSHGVQAGIPRKNLPKIFAVFSPGGHLDSPAYTGGFIMPSPIAIDICQEDFYHALTLNTALGIVMCIERHRAIKPFEGDCVIGCGNGFTSPVLAQAIADLTGLKVALYRHWNEATIYGMLLICKKGTGQESPKRVIEREYLPDCSEELRKYYVRWQSCRKTINDIEVN